jgi:hypothetical protein
MAQASRFIPVKLIAALIWNHDPSLRSAESSLVERFGPVDSTSRRFDFSLTDYYEKQMGHPLQRRFLSFERLVDPGQLAEIKLYTNGLEEKIRESQRKRRRCVNIDPGCLNGSSLIMATAKDFAHRIPLSAGIYAHLELLFGRDVVRSLDWTYPDFKSPQYHSWLLEVRKTYLEQLRNGPT